MLAKWNQILEMILSFKEFYFLFIPDNKSTRRKEHCRRELFNRNEQIRKQLCGGGGLGAVEHIDDNSPHNRPHPLHFCQHHRVHREPPGWPCCCSQQNNEEHNQHPHLQSSGNYKKTK